MGNKSTFTRRALNALVAGGRGDFAVYAYDKGHPGEEYWMLFDSSADGNWSHIERLTREEVWQQADKEAAAAPYATDFPLARKLLLHELSNSSIGEIAACVEELRDNHSEELALRISLAWLRDTSGLSIARDQVQNDLPGD